MSAWPQKPYIYQINTWVWLEQLSRQYNTPIHLGNVPDEVLDQLASLNVDAIWLMGVWHRSTAVRASALNYIEEYKHALPDITAKDVIGSAYAIGGYEVSAHLGGREGLSVMRWRLGERHLKLILDFVPNHVAVDHPWIADHPDYFITGTPDDLARDKTTFFMTTDSQNNDLVVGHGRDPYFPAWIDTAQLNAFSAGYRQAALDTLLDIGSQCDGVRCDMAMLVMNHIFNNTWNGFAGDPPETDFWLDIIPKVKAQYPDMIFIGEVYWDLEYALQQQGFDLTYDKTLYDRIVEGNTGKIHQHLWADMNYQTKSLRFIENHDEPRAATSLGIEKSRAAATLITTLAGGVLLHDGQFTGHPIKLPVQIGRGPDVTPNLALAQFYRRLLGETRDPIYRSGQWWLFDIQPSHANNLSSQNLLAYGWIEDEEYRLIIVNLTPHWSQGKIGLEQWPTIGENDWRLYDVLHNTYRYSEGNYILQHGLYVELEAYESRIYHLSIVKQPSRTRS